MSSSETSDINNQNNKPALMDLAQKITMVSKQNEKVQTQQTFRTTQPQMRMISIPGQTGTGQLIQTHIMPPTMLKPIDSTIRTQITSLPARTITQSSITVSNVSRSTTPRGPTSVSNIQSIRTPTPTLDNTIITNIGSGFVRGTVVAPPKTSSPAANVLSSPGSTPTWISGSNTVQVPAQLIRNTNINQSPRQQQQRIITQTPVSVNTSIGNAIVQQQQLQQTVSQQNIQQAQLVTSQTAQQQQQTFVATLAIPSSRQTPATLVYNNQQQHYGTPTQRLTTSIGVQRQVRPIQLGTARLPNSGMGVRVSTANIRVPSVPVLAPTSVLTAGNTTTLQGRTATVSATNLPATTTRIIQVQQQSTGGTQGRISGNLMTLHPVIVNTTAPGNRNPTTITSKVQPALTITHVKPGIGQNTSTPGLTQTQQMQQQHHQTGISSGTTTNNQQITQIVSVNQQNLINQGHQIVTVSQQQLLASQNQTTGIANIVPIRTTNVISGTINSMPLQTISTSTTGTAILRGSITAASTVTNLGGSSILPIAKVIPQQQQTQQLTSEPGNNITVGSQQTANVLIHTRSPSSGTVTGTTVIPSQGHFVPSTGTYYYEHTPNASTGNSVLTLTASSVNSGNNTNSSTSNLGSNLVNSVSYAPSSGGSFAVVPTNNRGISQIHANLGIVPNSNQQPQSGQVQTVPVRFNPQLIVDSSQTHQGTHQIITMSQGQTTQNQQGHMLIPVTSKMPSSSPRPSILRKRDHDGPSPVKVAKNLGPMLLSISSNNNNNNNDHDRDHRDHDIDRERDPSPQSRPGSSDGSTTASAISSPCLDQQDPEEIPNINHENEMQFKPVETMYQTNSQQTNSGHSIQHQISTGSSSNDNDVSPRKKPRKQQLGSDNNIESNSYVNEDVSYGENNKTNHISNNKENAQPVEVTYKKPRTSLLENYKQTWKPANNHFQRYADVRPREERRPNVMDLANQAHVLQKVNGWKIYHLTSQMQDLCDLESQVHHKLSDMLQFMEAHDEHPDVERVTDLIKGNRQRSKVIIDGVQDAQKQIMKIFDHKTHVSDIIHRCASKRNFKKREKM